MELNNTIEEHSPTEKQVTLYEFLVKTSYLTQITKPEKKNLDNPIGFGSGFIVEYEKEMFFVTADHTIHLDDYEGEELRTGNDYVVSIFNNYSDPDNFPSTALTPLGGFYYGDKFHVDKPDEFPKPVDIAVCKMKEKNRQLPFLTDGVTFTDHPPIKAGEMKFVIRKETFCEPDEGKNYFVFGKIRTRLRDNIRMEWQNTLKTGLRFASASGDYLLFKTPNTIVDYADWEGLSGSAVISEDGECVGVLCDILINSQSIWVMPISKVRMLIEVAILQDQFNEEKKG